MDVNVEPPVKIQNVVATGTLKQTIDLNAIVQAFPEVDYRPQTFPGAIFRLKRPKTSILIFTTGKMVCTGAKSEREAERALMEIVNSLNRGGIIITGRLDIKVVNIVASASLGKAVDIVEFYECERGKEGRLIYEPEQFPGLIYRMNEPRVVFLVFTSGEIVCTGATKVEEVHQGVNTLHKELEDKNVLLNELAS